MSSHAARTYGTVFDQVAEQYDWHRPGYPEVLVDRALQAGGLRPQAAVLEIGCGTGQLTRALVAHNLRITVVEPGAELIARTRSHLSDHDEVRFLHAPLEQAPISPGAFQSVFSASAIHWVDPDVGWRRAADALVDGGMLALLSYFGLHDQRCAEDQRALRQGLAAVAPELATAWPSYRRLDQTLAGVDARRDNVSAVWAWLGGYEIERAYAAELFGQASLSIVPMLVEHTGRELNALLGTMSFWARLSSPQRRRLAAYNEALHERLGRPIRSSVMACLVTAHRRSGVS